MERKNRREFLKSAAGFAAIGAGGRPDTRLAAYERAVGAETSLLAWWRLNGELKDAKGRADGDMSAGQPAFVDGPLGGKGIVLAGGRFLTMGFTPHLDTAESAIELFFELTAKPAAGYNPCLIASRASSPETRWSVHVQQDLAAIDIWNGRGVCVVTPPEVPLEVGRWYLLDIANKPGELQVYLDGVACQVSESGYSFNLEQKGKPLQVGASAPDGAEACDCAVAEVAIYGSALPEASITRHADAAGLAEKRKRIAREKRRREEERMKARAEGIAKRLRDPQLMAKGEQKVYRGDQLTGIAFGLGGIGAGSIQMNGKAERSAWQIFNNFAGAAIPNSFFAVRAKPEGAEPVVRALQTSRVGPFPAMKDLSLRGEYPFAWYDFEDPDLPVRVSMEAFTPLIPLNEKDSSIPCAIFTLTATNPGTRPLEVSFLATQQNAVGYTGKGTILDRRHPSYGGNVNRIIHEDSRTILHMTSQKGSGEPGIGDMVLAASVGVDGQASFGSVSGLLDEFRDTGSVSGEAESGPSPAGETVNGALSDRFRIQPGQSAGSVFILAWHFPNARNGGDIVGWEHGGNMYCNWWTDALDSARYVVAHFSTLQAQTWRFHRTLYRSNLPRWLVDRISSQVAILRSKTCFWAADGYFGAWEGCAPESGCCAGSCAHVWHYAQAHARLFPGIARKMREEVFADQAEDGGLPHRQPHEFPAIDGHLGDILGVYREHLCSADSGWLKPLWPKVKKAMDYAIHRWDADEDGVLSGAQWNTLDGNLGGSTSWMGTLYLAALEASARMAEMHGESDWAARCRRIRASGARQQNDTLWNGEYYIQLLDKEHYSDYGEGCEIDQLLGEWWARQVDIGPAYPQDRARTALQSLLKYNFQPDFHGVTQAPRKFVDDGDTGLQMIHWPRGNRPSPCILYGDEVMTGFEYAAAGAMIQHGLLREGLMVAKAISDRYDGRIRTGLTPGGSASWGYSGNPFGDDECGKYYARAMSVWSLLLACQGFIYDGPAGVIGLLPVWKPEDHASFFTAAEGWGLFTQKRAGKKQTERIEVAFGQLRVNRLVFELPGGRAPGSVRVTLQGRELPSTTRLNRGRVEVDLATESVIPASQALDVEME